MYVEKKHKTSVSCVSSLDSKLKNTWIILRTRQKEIPKPFY